MVIEWDEVAGTFTRIDDRETLPMLRLDAQEALALAVAGRLFDRWGASPFGRILDTMLKKIAPVFGGAVSVAVESVEKALSKPGLDDEQGLEYFFPLLEAILERKELRIDYVKHGATTAEPRTAYPLHLTELRDRWVLLAHDLRRGKIRQFVLSRIEGFTTTGSTFEPPSDFNAREYLAGCLGAFAGTEEHEVRLALDAHAAFYAREKPWHASQRLADLPDGRVELKLRISHLADAKNAALQWGDHVEVLSPPELRADVRAALAKALAQYA
jgi:predicted DNA-binding transcriptional regulator YafY